MYRIKMVLLGAIVSTLCFSQDAFEKHCVPCHDDNGISLQKAYMNALLVYGGRENMRVGLAYYLKNPRKDTSVMGSAVIQEHGIKKPTELDDDTLNRVLDIYWDKYTVIGKIY